MCCHISSSKACFTVDLSFKEIHVDALAGNVMAGARDTAGPAPDVHFLHIYQNILHMEKGCVLIMHIAILPYCIFSCTFLAYSGINQVDIDFNLLLKHLPWPALAVSGSWTTTE